ncbi:hypothetical protein N4R57_16540 [Rhodobacteraceae bacterium D3-12]|nr:hypothetical protein N4R57_16540 [Rhodobacteraceae bacterium D3-12]
MRYGTTLLLVLASTPALAHEGGICICTRMAMIRYGSPCWSGR